MSFQRVIGLQCLISNAYDIIVYISQHIHYHSYNHGSTLRFSYIKVILIIRVNIKVIVTKMACDLISAA